MHSRSTFCVKRKKWALEPKWILFLIFHPRRFLIGDEILRRHLFKIFSRIKRIQLLEIKLQFLTSTFDCIGFRAGMKEKASCSRTCSPTRTEQEQNICRISYAAYDMHVLWSPKRKYAAFQASASWMRNDRCAISIHKTRTCFPNVIGWEWPSSIRWRQWNYCRTGNLWSNLRIF